MKSTRQEKLADHLTELDEDLLHNAYEIDDAQKLADYAKSKNTRPQRKAPLFRRIAVLAACLVLTVTAAVTLPFAFSEEQTPDTDEIVLPPVRVGTEGYSQASLSARSSTIESLCEYIDVIAVVRVGNWLDEDTHHTYYNAEVLDLIAGTLPDQFVLLQDGNSKCTMKGYPLFTYGDEFLLFLVKADYAPEEGCAYPNKNSYWIAGSYSTVMEVVEGENGNYYFVDRYHLLDRSAIELINLKTENTVNTMVHQTLASRDAEVSQFKAPYTAIYSLEELATKLPTLTKGG